MMVILLKKSHIAHCGPILESMMMVLINTSTTTRVTSSFHTSVVKELK